MRQAAVGLLQDVLNEKVMLELPFGILDVGTAIDEALAWITDATPYRAQHHQHSWTSSVDDMASSLAALGPHLASCLERPATSAVRALEPLAHQTQAPPSERRQAGEAALIALRAAFVTGDALTAAWRDLVDGASAPADTDQLRMRLNCLLAVLRDSGRNPDSVLQTVRGVLSDDGFWQWQARYLAGEDELSERANWPALETQGGLSFEERIALCERVVSAPPHSHDHVVWVAFDHAGVRGHPGIRLGVVTFYDASLIRSAVAQASDGGQLPSELYDPNFGEHWIPDGDEVVLARVDLGRVALADAPAEARRRARALVQAAVFRTGIKGQLWTALDDYVHFVDGRFAGSASRAREELPLGVDAREAVGTELEALASSAIASASPADLDQLETFSWFRDASRLSAAQRLVLDVRVLERVSVRAEPGKATWWSYLDSYWRNAWVRDQVGWCIVMTLREVWPSTLFPSRDAESDVAVRLLLTDVIRFDGRGGWSVDLAAGIRVLPQLVTLVSEESWLGARVRTIAERTSTTAQLVRWVEAVEGEWDRRRARAQRTRNSLTHGGPVNDRVAGSAAEFVHQLASFSLSEEFEAITVSERLLECHERVAAKAREWRSSLPCMPDAATAFSAIRSSVE